MSSEHGKPPAPVEFFGGSSFTVYRSLLSIGGVDIIQAPDSSGMPLLIFGEKINATRFLSGPINQVTNRLEARKK